MFVDRILGAIAMFILVLGCLWACDSSDSDSKTPQSLNKPLSAAYQGALAGIYP